MEIKEIKQSLSIEKVLQHYNLHPDKNNRLCCPFHNDKTSSFQIYPKTNTWTCFSSNCDAGSGDQIDFIEKQEAITKHEAILKAKGLCGYVGELKPLVPKPTITQKERTEILTTAFSHFARGLKSKPKKAIEYLESRKLDYKELSIGYDAGTLHKAKEITTEQKQIYLQAGLLNPDKFGRKNSYYTRFNNCIVFPLLDKYRNIASLYGRHIEGGHHYLYGEHKGLYPNYPKEETIKLILTEAIIDAATIQQIPEITKEFTILALYGTNGFTEEHRKVIAELKQLKEVVLFFDGDQSGKEAVKNIAEELKQINKKLLITVIDTPVNEDINSLLQGHEPEIFTHLLENRIGFSFSTEKSIEKEKTPKPVPINNQSPIENHKLKVSSDYIFYETNQLQITLWGGIEIHQISRLRATLHIQLKANIYSEFRDTVDLYSHSQTEKLIRQSSEKLEISSTIVTESITELTKQLEQYRSQKREEKRQQEQEQQQQNKDIFSKEQIQQASNFLQNPELTKNTFEMFGKLGLIGQQENGMLLFFIFLTRLFKNPLHAIVMGSSGSGKTHLLQGVAATVPKQHINVTTSLSENTLYYTPKDFKKNKILLQEDLDGAYSALLPLRELMSNQSISRFSTKTNSRTGDSKQIYLQVDGPVCVAGATTKEKIYEDNANRSFLIQIEESPQQESEILAHQGKIAAGLINNIEYEKTINRLKTCQLLLKPYEVIIPFATKLELPQAVFKKLRTKTHYLTLIKSITLWNQKQRKTKKDEEGNFYLISTLEDVYWANFLSKEALLRKSDELGGKPRQFFESLKLWLLQDENSNGIFYGKQARKHFRLHPQQVKRYFDELYSRGYITCKSKSYKQGDEYEIIVWDDYEKLKNGVDILDRILKKLKDKTKVLSQ